MRYQGRNFAKNRCLNAMFRNHSRQNLFFATQINNMGKQNLYETNQIYEIQYGKFQFALDSL